MTETLKPQTAGQVLEAVAWAVASENPLEVVAGGSKRGFGRPVAAAHRLDLGALSGIGLYEPGELVMSAAAATPMAEIEAALGEYRQQLAFEPPDLGPLFGGAPNAGTIGGAIACNLGGPRRIKAGAARDHVLGFAAVSGRGETFKSGGRVVKNVTGFDLSKLMAGSFGTLGVMTEITFKVLPAAEETRTVVIHGDDMAVAVEAMTEALRSPYEVSGAAHVRSMTAIRIEGPGPSVDYRCRVLREMLSGYGDTGELDGAESAALWRQVGDVSLFAGESDSQVWRLSVPPAAGAGVAEAVRGATGGRVFLDWGGGLLWLVHEPRPDACHEAVRGALAECGGHATLVRAADEVRASVPVFQPRPGPLADLEGRIKDAFDPKGVLNPGRMDGGT